MYYLKGMGANSTTPVALPGVEGVLRNQSISPATVTVVVVGSLALVVLAAWFYTRSGKGR